MKKYIARFVLLILAFTFCFSLTANANEKEYVIKSAVFEMQINEDGSVDVVENWLVDYQQGKFSRFYKNIYLNVPKSEKFSIDFQGIEIDGKNCSLTQKTNTRPDYTYALVEDVNTLRYEAYVSSENETRSYQVSYTLNNVVKHVDNDYYLFVYRILPKGYKAIIEDFKVEITLPQNVSLEHLNKTSGSKSDDDNVITILDENVSDLYKVSLKLNGSGFEEFTTSSNLSENELNDGDETLNGFAFALSAIIVLVILFIILAIVLEVSEQRRVKRLLSENPNLLNAICNKWSNRLSPAEFVCLTCSNIYLVFLVYLADLVKRNVIHFSDDYKNIMYPKNLREDKYYFEIWKILEDCRIFAEKAGYIVDSTNDIYILPTAYFEQYFKKYKNYKKINKMLSTLTKKVNINQSEIQKDKRMLSQILPLMYKDTELPIVKYSEIINNYGNNHVDALYYCMQKDLHACVDGDDSAYLTLLAIATYTLLTQYNDNACIGCSSCGGGCGGCGGAD